MGKLLKLNPRRARSPGCQLEYFGIFTPNVWGNDPIWRLHIFQMGWWKTTSVCPHLLVTRWHVLGLLTKQTSRFNTLKGRCAVIYHHLSLPHLPQLSGHRNDTNQTGTIRSYLACVCRLWFIRFIRFIRMLHSVLYPERDVFFPNVFILYVEFILPVITAKYGDFLNGIYHSVVPILRRSSVDRGRTSCCISGKSTNRACNYVLAWYVATM